MIPQANPSLLNEDDLKAWTGFERRSKLEQWLRQNHIHFTYGKGNKIITTRQAVNQALGAELGQAANQEDGFF